jgi:hypothetical protein
MTQPPVRARAILQVAVLAAATVLLALVTAPGASAQGQADIHSAGPLTDIWIEDDLRCQVAHAGEPNHEFYPPTSTVGSCGSLLSVGGASGATLYGFRGNAWTPVSQSAVGGSGTEADPFQLTTVVQASDNPIFVTETDSYVVGTEYYRTDLTVTNAGSAAALTNLKLYHAADCYLQGSDYGFGFVDATSRAVACAQNPSNSPPALVEEFTPLTGGSHYEENYYGTHFSHVEAQADLPDGCHCNGDPNTGEAEDNGMGLNWSIASLGPGQSRSFSLLSNFSASGVTSFQISAAGGASFSGRTGSPISGQVAAFTDPNQSDTASDFSASINWGDGSTSAGSISGAQGTFAVAGSHTYDGPGAYTITVTISRLGNLPSTATATGSASIGAAPTPVVTGGASAVGSGGVGLSGSLNPAGLPTTVVFQYGLDPRYSGGGPVVYTNSTPAQAVAPDFASHTVSASVSGLVPNALYHYRLVATNSAGTTMGADLTFTTAHGPKPNQPTLGRTFNIAPVSGRVLVEIDGQFVPLTQLRQIPRNALINAVHGSLELITASGGATSGAHDAAARSKKAKTQRGTFGGAIFKLSQTTRGSARGLVTLTLVEGAFRGAPSYATCRQHKAGEASAAALSSRTLQLLRSTARGRFTTRGRYGAATVRGTKWTIADRCDGTLVRDIVHSVAVTDFVRHKTVVLRPGQSYLAKARK